MALFLCENWDIWIWSKYWASWKVLPLWCGAFLVPFLKNGWTKLIKGHFSHTGCPKNGFILEQKLRYNDMIKILSPLKSVVFLMWCICGVFFQKWINRTNKRHTPYHKGKTFPGTQYFDYIRISKVLHQNKAILTFWTPYIAKMALY